MGIFLGAKFLLIINFFWVSIIHLVIFPYLTRLRFARYLNFCICFALKPSCLSLKKVSNLHNCTTFCKKTSLKASKPSTYNDIAMLAMPLPNYLMLYVYCNKFHIYPPITRNDQSAITSSLGSCRPSVHHFKMGNPLSAFRIGTTSTLSRLFSTPSL